MPIELQPKDHYNIAGVLQPGPVPRYYRPPGGIPYTVVTGDTWKTLAQRWFLNIGDLPYYNFRTSNSDEINWYLRWYVGCKVATKDKKNWEFSSNLNPGIIYRPPSKPIVSQNAFDDFNDRIGSGTDLGKAITKAEHSNHSAHTWHFRLDIAHFGLMALEIAGAHLVEMGIGGAMAAVVSGPLMGILNFMNLGMGHMDAIDNIKTDRLRRGLAQGILLGAAEEPNSFIRDKFVYGSEEYGVEYKEQNKNFQNAYLWGLVRGLQLGGKLTRYERKLLFKQIDNYPPVAAYSGAFYANRSRKSDSEKFDYYLIAAAKLRKKSGG